MALKVALVTGAGKRRVGYHVAQALAERGYALAIHYNRSAADAAETIAALEARGTQAIAIQADFTDDTAIPRMVKRVIEHFGRIDVLVNCAAEWKAKRLEDITAADVRYYLDINTLATFVCSREAGLVMVKQPDGGCIITFADWAIERPYLDYAAYFPSKGAIPALTRSLAVELGTRNPAVRVNCILPGPVLLPPNVPQKEKEHAIRGTIVKREGKPQHVVQAVLFLIDNDFLTGICLPVDGGRSIYAAEI